MLINKKLSIFVKNINESMTENKIKQFIDSVENILCMSETPLSFQEILSEFEKRGLEISKKFTPEKISELETIINKSCINATNDKFGDIRFVGSIGSGNKVKKYNNIPIDIKPKREIRLYNSYKNKTEEEYRKIEKNFLKIQNIFKRVCSNREKLINDPDIDIALDIYLKKIASMPPHKALLLMFALLNKEKMFQGKKDDIDLLIELQYLHNKNYSKTKHIKEFIHKLEDHIKYSTQLGKDYGEVMTPITLINQMLDRFPEEDWSNPYLKWLDPANGVGPFMSIVVDRLMEGLKNYNKDGLNLTEENERYRYIIENMIYVCEIQDENMLIWWMTINPHCEYNINIYDGSFFDVKNLSVNRIVGNPPYNIGQYAEGKRGGGDTLWDKFVIKCLNENLTKEGLLCFVHPTLWRKPQSEKSSSKEVNELMMRKQIHYLEMHNSEDGMKIFGKGTRYDFYLLENSDIYKETIINDENRMDVLVDLRKYNFIPNKNINFFDKIVASKGEETCPIIFNVSNYETRKNWVYEKNEGNFIYPLVHTTPKNGIRYKYSSRNDNGHFGISKVIFGDSGIYDCIIDMEGKYGMTQHAMAIQVSSLEEAENIKKALLSDNFSKFLESVMWSNFQIDWRLFTYLKRDFWKQF